MQVPKTHDDTSSPAITEGPSPTRARQPIIDAAMDAGLAKVDFYKTDKWIVGKNEEKSYIAARNSLPEPLAKSFLRSAAANPVTKEVSYDKAKFTIDECPDFDDPTGKGSRVTIYSSDMHDNVADVEFHGDTFVVYLFNQPKSGAFPFSKDDLLKAVDAAKWSLELFVLPKPYEASEYG